MAIRFLTIPWDSEYSPETFENLLIAILNLRDLSGLRVNVVPEVMWHQTDKLSNLPRFKT